MAASQFMLRQPLTEILKNSSVAYLIGNLFKFVLVRTLSLVSKII